MACSHISVVLILTLTLALVASCSASQGFRSINCGGEAYYDSNTTLHWEGDPYNNNSQFYGEVGNVASSLRNIPSVMKTLRYFPTDPMNKKFCYSLQVSNGSTYLLRASFLYGNYDQLNEPPTFVLILNHDQWKNVTTNSSPTPIVHELTIVAKGHDLDICLAYHLDSSGTRATPFISTLELRLLAQAMYNSNAFSRGYGLMLHQRINYGARTKAQIRYPDDAYDRIWETNTSGPTANTSTDKLGVYSGKDAEEPPVKVMATAITTTDLQGNLSFTYPDFGGFDDGVRIELHCQEVDEKLRGHLPPRNFSLELPPSTIIPGIEALLGGPTSAILDDQIQLPFPLRFTLFPLPTSPRGPLLNAIELFRWTPQPLSTIRTFQGDVDTIKTIQSHFKLMGFGQGDPCMPKDYRWTWISCTYSIEPRIIEINLASLNLSGDIPPSINNLANLQRLDLSSNLLHGQIPDVMFLKDLESLDLHNNLLTGELPPSLRLLPKLNKLDVSNNKLCGVSSLSSPTLIHYSYGENSGQCKSLKSSNSSMLRKYVFSTFFLGGLHLVSIFTVLVIYKARSSGKKEETSTSTTTIDKKGFDDPKGLPFVTKIFTYNEIRDATFDFTILLGEGGFGKVYHGLLPTTGEAVAVKLLADASKQGLKEFYNEVAILSRVRHRNLVSLIGYCVENTYMLIYEYIAKGNLRDLLYGEVESSDKPLPWTTRLRIAFDASQGLEYLHMGCDRAIFHRDVKSSNILLTHKMEAKVADFGLSRLKEGDNAISHVSTINVAGTIGYLDPAYYATKQFTDKSDVYSFGIVLFELICGRAPINIFNSLPHIVDWVTPAIEQGKFGEIVDPVLENGYKEESMRKVVDVAFACVNRDRMKRPKMRQVSQLLQNALEVEMKEGFSPPSGDSSATILTHRELSSLRHFESLSITLEPC